MYVSFVMFYAKRTGLPEHDSSSPVASPAATVCSALSSVRASTAAIVVETTLKAECLALLDQGTTFIAVGSLCGAADWTHLGRRGPDHCDRDFLRRRRFLRHRFFLRRRLLFGGGLSLLGRGILLGRSLGLGGLGLGLGDLGLSVLDVSASSLYPITNVITKGSAHLRRLLDNPLHRGRLDLRRRFPLCGCLGHRGRGPGQLLLGGRVGGRARDLPAAALLHASKAVRKLQLQIRITTILKCSGEGCVIIFSPQGVVYISSTRVQL